MAQTWPCLWALADASNPLPFWTDPPSEEILTQLEAFNVRLSYGAWRTLPQPATKWIDVLVLIPPDFEWDTVVSLP